MLLNSRLMAHRWACALGFTVTTKAGAALVVSRPILNKEAVNHAIVYISLQLLW